MRQTVTKMIGIASCEDLRFRLDPAKSPGMNDAAAVGLLGNIRVREFFLNLLIDARCFLWIGGAESAGKLQKHEGTRNQRARLIRKSPKQFYPVVVLAGAHVNDGHLVLSHGGKFL